MRVIVLIAVVALLCGPAVAKHHQKHLNPEESGEDYNADAPAGSVPIVEDHDGPEAVWGYSDDEEGGPSTWGQEDSRHRECRLGEKQSPVDLPSDGVSLNNEALKLDFNDYAPLNGAEVHVDQSAYDSEEPERGALINTGHYFLMHWAKESEFKFGEDSFHLDSLSFHSPSEHTVDGEHMPLEMQVLHTSEAGKVVGISVLFDNKGEGRNAFLDSLGWKNLPNAAGLSHVVGEVDLLQGYPEDREAYYHYQGSLTHPPCTEGVEWLIFSNPVHACPEQIEEHRAVLEDNFRPTQELGDRAITVSKPLFISPHETEEKAEDGGHTETTVFPDQSVKEVVVDVGGDNDNPCDGCSFEKDPEWRAKALEQSTDDKEHKEHKGEDGKEHHHSSLRLLQKKLKVHHK